MSGADTPGPDGPQDVTELRRAIELLAEKVETLGEQAARLLRAVEALSPPAGSTPPETVVVDDGDPAGDDTGPFRVVISPAPELALVAVAETTLRDLPGVRRIVDMRRGENRARFDLDLEPGLQLTESLRAAMPVPFEMISSTETELVIAMRSAWSPTTLA